MIFLNLLSYYYGFIDFDFLFPPLFLSDRTIGYNNLNNLIPDISDNRGTSIVSLS
jgi:hypothetical protein